MLIYLKIDVKINNKKAQWILCEEGDLLPRFQRVGQLKGRVSLEAVTAVEFVDEEAFNLPHTFQVSCTHSVSLSLSLSFSLMGKHA